MVATADVADVSHGLKRRHLRPSEEKNKLTREERTDQQKQLAV
jgi:hypothetical protein